MEIWVVIYMTNLGHHYGWFCRAISASKAEDRVPAIGIAAIHHNQVRGVVPIKNCPGVTRVLWGGKMSDKPKLIINLSGPGGNIFMVLGRATFKLSGLLAEQFTMRINDAIAEHKSYEGLLAITNEFVQIIDTSGTYQQYALPKRSIDETLVIQAVNKLNERLRTLTDASTTLEGLFIEFGSDDYGPEVYLLLLEQEMGDIDKKLAQYLGFSKLRIMLQDCLNELHQAGL